MSAKEMFEELGYEKEIANNKIVWFKGDGSYREVYEFKKEYGNNYKTNCAWSSNQKELNIAIQKQIEELGWE